MSAHLTQRHPTLYGSVHCIVAWPLRSYFEKHYSKQLRSLSRRSRHHTCDEAYPRWYARVTFCSRNEQASARKASLKFGISSIFHQQSIFLRYFIECHLLRGIATSLLFRAWVYDQPKRFVVRSHFLRHHGSCCRPCSEPPPSEAHQIWQTCFGLLHHWRENPQCRAQASAWRQWIQHPTPF